MASKRLTDISMTTGVTLSDIIHIVVTGDTSQDPAGSSYSASLQQVYDSFNIVNSIWDYKVVDVTSSDILNIGTSPIILLSGDTTIYYDYKIIIEYTHVTTPYTLFNFSGDLVLRYDATYNIPQLITTTNNSVAITFPTITNGRINMSPIQDVILTTNNGTDPTLGDGTIKVKIWYKRLTFG
jgi:hypothetical protein